MAIPDFSKDAHSGEGRKHFGSLFGFKHLQQGISVLTNRLGVVGALGLRRRQSTVLKPASVAIEPLRIGD